MHRSRGFVVHIKPQYRAAQSLSDHSMLYCNNIIILILRDNVGERDMRRYVMRARDIQLSETPSSSDR